MTDEHKIGVGLLVVLAAALMWSAVRASPGGVKVPAANSEDLNFWYAPLARPVVGPDEHVNGYTYTPHRYPKLTGGELTTLMHRGWATVGLPSSADNNWISNPPGEVDL